ncbi:RHS repeat-associated core domain-containing protein, partial [Chryseobacterium lathyri]|uniref:RHS repeat-associated core domain-containing protein n=2 Tax=Chryseobacterium lathyri TaxID=395933 RepID=UPI00142D656A
GAEQNTDYLDGFQYNNLETFGSTVPTVPTLKFAPTPEGYFDFEKNKYIYNYIDHLGNVRLSYFNNGAMLEVVEENNYYPFGLKHGSYNSLPGNYSYQYKYNGKELQESGMYDYGARFYMPDIGRWGVVDPLSEQYRRHSTYNYAVNNPIRFIDPDGRGINDFVQRQDGSIYWDKNANSQATTKNGEYYLGKELTFNFRSYIDGKLWDGPTPPFIDPAGNKLTSTLKLTGRENEQGELTSMVGEFSSAPGITPIGTPRDFYPGEGGSNNVFGMSTTSTGINVNFEQHASVSPIEELGLNAAGFKIVDVAQKLNINFTNSNGNLSIEASTNVFPSADLTVLGNGDPYQNHYLLMQYNQPSFPGTHTAPNASGITVTPRGTTAPKRDFSYYPSKFYKRN